jgi:N-sulfoglucosamine sulfohydrolase
MLLIRCFLFAAIFLLLPPLSCRAAEPAPRRPPNIVLIVGEDMGPELGCYGDANAITPNMDRLAAQGARFTRCFTHAPVCAPSRSGLISGRYPTTIGTHHMRSRLLKPPPLFTDYLKKTGYTIAWPTQTAYGKTDFNFPVPPKAFDRTKDWTKDIPKQPFFGFYNIFTTHESQIRVPAARFAKITERLKASERRDAAKMKLPAYYPDTPEVRRDLANYYELVTAVDYQVGVVLDALDKAGIADNTIVFLTGDHGRGLPRGKRWVYNRGIHVPLIVRWPGHVQPGSVRDDLVCFLDFAPTMLALAGVEPPKEMQGQIIVGPKKAAERKYIFAARDRMDETFDRIRTVRGKHYQYIRNFHPELSHAQRISYMELMPTMKAWRKLHAEGKLNAVQDAFFAANKPKEELYDVDADPDEVKNLAGDPKYKEKLVELRTALDRWMDETKDLGAVPERELIERGLVADSLSQYEKQNRDKKGK